MELLGTGPDCSKLRSVSLSRSSISIDAVLFRDLAAAMRSRHSTPTTTHVEDG